MENEERIKSTAPLQQSLEHPRPACPVLTATSTRRSEPSRRCVRATGRSANVSVEIKRGANRWGRRLVSHSRLLTCWIPIIGLLPSPFADRTAPWLHRVIIGRHNKTGFAFRSAAGLSVSWPSSSPFPSQAVAEGRIRCQPTGREDQQSVVPSDPEAQTPPTMPNGEPHRLRQRPGPHRNLRSNGQSANAVRQGECTDRNQRVRIGRSRLRPCRITARIQRCP